MGMILSGYSPTLLVTALVRIRMPGSVGVAPCKRIGELLECFRGSYRRHAAKGFYMNKGGPLGPSGACKVGQATTRGRPFGLVEVRLADSTPRSGEPITWGSGQQKLNRSWET
jgi:hypothetical protein